MPQILKLWVDYSKPGVQVSINTYEFMNAKVEGDLKNEGKVVDADEMLRPQLKSLRKNT